MEQSTKTRGGKRPGCGRPKLDTQQLNIRLDKTALSKLNEASKHSSKSKIIQDLICNFL